MKASLRGALARFSLLGALAGCAAGRVSLPPAQPPVAIAPSASTDPAARVAAHDEAVPAPLASTRTPAVTPAPAPGSAGSSEKAGSTPAQDPPSTPAAALAQAEKAKDGPERVPLGWIAGQPLESEELLVEWSDLSSRELLLVVDKLVAARLSLAEASRLGIRLAPEAVEQRVADERAHLEEQVAKSGKKRTLEEFIERELGLEPARYLERVRRATIRQMLAERAVRAGSLASETVSLRLIVVPDEAGMKKVQEALAAGRDFGDVARELSVDESKQNGGLVPFVVAQERSPLARIAFQTQVGEVAGPLPVADHQFLIKVEERRAPLEGDWNAIEKAVEDSLARYPVADAEFVHWKLAMESRYPVDLGPLWSLIGAAK